MKRNKLWPYRSRGYRFPVRLPALLISLTIFIVLLLLRSEQEADWRFMFAVKDESITHSLMPVATSLKTSKPSFTIQQSAEAKSFNRTTTMSLSVQLDPEGLRGQIKAKGRFIPTDFRFVSDNDIRAALNVVDGNIEAGKRRVFVEDSSFDWNAKKFLLIVATWRSGSTFLSEIFANHPAVFLHYEPLVYLGRHQVRTENQNKVAVEHLNGLFHCKYNNRDYNRKVKRITQDLIGHNVQVWNACQNSTNPSVCKETWFLESACERFPVILTKVVRLRLESTRQLLAELPHFKVIFLVRDPRASMNSRHQATGWGCDKYEDCNNPQLMCQDAQSDLDALDALSHAYPGRILMVKYETLALEPVTTFQEIFRFADLPYLTSVDHVIRNRTSTEQDNPWSIYRKSSERIDLWKTQLDRQTIDSIQSACTQVLSRLNYSLV